MLNDFLAVAMDTHVLICAYVHMDTQVRIDYVVLAWYEKWHQVKEPNFPELAQVVLTKWHNFPAMAEVVLKAVNLFADNGGSWETL